jgi:hypothetical protein
MAARKQTGKTPKRLARLLIPGRKAIVDALAGSAPAQASFARACGLLRRAAKLGPTRAERQLAWIAFEHQIGHAAGLIWEDADVRAVSPARADVRNQLLNWAILIEAPDVPPEALRPVRQHRLDPSDRARIERRDGDYVAIGLGDADAPVRRRVLAAIDLLTAVDRGEAISDPGRPGGTKKPNKLGDKSEFIDRVHTSVYAKTGRINLRTYLKKTIATWMGVSPPTLRQRLEDHGYTWDDLLDRRI